MERNSAAAFNPASLRDSSLCNSTLAALRPKARRGRLGHLALGMSTSEEEESARKAGVVGRVNRRAALQVAAAFGMAGMASAAKAEEEKKGEDLNVYGKPLAQCGIGSPGSGEGNYCTYRPYDAGAHQVCVTSLPNGFSSKTGQGAWSNQFTGQPWCICIWAYSNYVLSNGDRNLPVQCNAVSQKVLRSEYALKKFQSCGSMASPCSDYNQAIVKMCDRCKATAPDATGRAFLQMLCNDILGAAAKVLTSATAASKVLTSATMK